MQEVMKAGKIDVCQVCWNLLWRREERELIPFCHANNIRLVTYSSLAEGILTGKFPARIDFAPGDHRKYTVLFDEKLWPRIHAAVDEMKLVAADAHRPLGHCAIRWLTAKKDVDTVLVGARNAAQVAENAAAETGEIDESVFSRLTEISDRLLPDIPDAGNIFKWYP
jgi:aryl-alcohol dehydrogenase-like predicted oxidoreductase